MSARIATLLVLVQVDRLAHEESLRYILFAKHYLMVLHGMDVDTGTSQTAIRQAQDHIECQILAISGRSLDVAIERLREVLRLLSEPPLRISEHLRTPLDQRRQLVELLRRNVSHLTMIAEITDLWDLMLPEFDPERSRREGDPGEG